ncbi:hypothetical protein Y1Q_0018216 [Alligator mississippiensis]|uniref:Reverse transcriptase RNase H-like domain-containing protein n=1 Tax=Alligator mississippiensis TaxID=8496 RepID=A0A151PEW4_ALLMI|nr:hypothetical protein Y1Q_0018216 [Alligator mississippiensis]
MEELGVIRVSTSPWASPVVLVRRQDGTIHFCVDYWKLNAITTPDAYPMSRMDTLLDFQGPAKVISTLNLSKGFWQMALDPDAMAKSAFTTPIGLYEFTVLPFDMRTSPASFQRLINNLLQGCEQFSMSYIDDIAIFSQDFESHLTHLTTVLGLGAVLLQEHQKTQHPMVHLSQKIIPWEWNLSSIEKECLAIIWALNKLKPYLWGQQFTLLSDHAPLQWLQTMQNTNAKLQRWAWQLQEFNFTIEHIKGSQNVIADALSRKDSGSGSSGLTTSEEITSELLDPTCLDHGPERPCV